VTLANADQYYVHATAPASGGGSAPTVSQIVAGVWDEPVTGNTTAGTFGAAVNDVLTDTGTTLDDLVDDLESRLGTPSNLGGGATVAANLSDIEGQTDDIGAAGAGLTAADDAVITVIGAAGAGLTAVDDAIMTRVGAPVGASISADIAAVESGISWNSAWDAEVQSEADDALVARDLHFLLDTTYDPTAEPAADSLFGDLTESDAGVTRFTSNAVEQAPTSGGGNMTQIEGVDATDAIDARITAAALATASSLSAVDAKIGTPSNLGGGASLAANNVDIEAQTDDIGTAGAGLTAADDAVMTRLGSPAGASVSADIATRASQTSVDTVDDLLDTEVAAVAAAIAALPAQVRDAVSEDQGTVSRGCIEAVLLAFAAGDISTTGSTTTWRDPSNAEVRITSTVTSNGNRTASITCPTY
jgi:hypothetical protein